MKKTMTIPPKKMSMITLKGTLHKNMLKRLNYLKRNSSLNMKQSMTLDSSMLIELPLTEGTKLIFRDRDQMQGLEHSITIINIISIPMDTVSKIYLLIIIFNDID